MSQKKKTDKVGTVSIADLRKNINKKAGQEVAFSLNGENPSEVTSWIPTGSRWLDSIITKGRYAGIPVGKISEIAGLESVGKSYIAACIAANAQKMGMNVVYFDSESSIDPEFLKKLGVDLESETFTYVQATNVEFVFETIEDFLKIGNSLFIWDSFANTPCKSDVEDGSFDPNNSMSLKPRIVNKAMAKLTLPIANTNSAILVLNQLKTNIAAAASGNKYAFLTEPWVTPGGKTWHYVYSLRIWLTGLKNKDSLIFDENGYRIGFQVKAKIKKSRFASEGRECFFKVIWSGENVGIQNDESIFEALKLFNAVESSGPWWTLKCVDGKEIKFQSSQWKDKMKNDLKFRQEVEKVMDNEVIHKFQTKSAKASVHYSVDGEDEQILDDENISEEEVPE